MRVKLTKRIETPKYLYLLIPMISVFVGLFIGYLILKIAAITSPEIAKIAIENVYSSTLWISLSDPSSISIMMDYSIPIGLIALGYVFAYKVRFWSIGGEGQMLIGWIFATGVYVSFLQYECPDYILTASPTTVKTLMILGAMIAGGLWALLPATLRIFLNVNEVLTTLMLNYSAYYIIWYLAPGPWRDPCGWGFIKTPTLLDELTTPKVSISLGPGREISFSTMFIVLIAIAVTIYFVIKYTKFGFELRVVGDNPKAARYAGINIPSVYLVTNFLGGMLAGLAGYVVFESNLTLRPVMPGYGYSAIVASWLAFLNPIATLFSSLLLGYIFNMSTALQAATGIHRSFSDLIYGSILVSIISFAFLLDYTIKFIKR